MSTTWLRKWSPEDADRLFNADGSVKLPKSIQLCISLAISEPRQCLTRQPTRERAEAVGEAVREMVEERGYTMVVKQSRTDESFGLYVALPVAEPAE